jgi:hypothetical protein
MLSALLSILGVIRVPVLACCGLIGFAFPSESSSILCHFRFFVLSSFVRTFGCLSSFLSFLARTDTFESGFLLLSSSFFFFLSFFWVWLSVFVLSEERESLTHRVLWDRCDRMSYAG